MQIQVIDGYITGYAITGGFPDGIDVSDDFIQYLDLEKLGFYLYQNGEAVLDEEKYETFKSAKEEAALKDLYIPTIQASIEAIGKAILSTLDLDDNTKIQVSGLYSDWSAGSYVVGDIRNAKGQTWECFQVHDNAVYPDINPENSAWYTFWRPLHGKSPETARPFVPVQGAHDMYHTGEYMIWTDGFIYRCDLDTNFSPTEYARAWSKEGE